MGLKKKLFTTISMFCLTIAMLMVGVWAVSSDQVSFGGTITFTATNILATISGEVSGTASDPTLQDLVYNSAGGPSTTALNSWSNNLTFKEDGSAFSIEITIKNESSRKIYWSISDTVDANASISKTISTYTLGDTNELDGNGTTTFTITIGLANGTNNSVSGSYGYQIDLKDESEYVVDPNAPVDITNGHDYLNFGTPANGSISVTGFKDSTVTEVIIPAKVIKSGVTYDVTSIGNEAFRNCREITSLLIGNQVTDIGQDSFKDCSSLINITIPDSVTNIGSSAFNGCTSLVSINIPADVSRIYMYAFYKCTSLTTVYVDCQALLDNYSMWSSYLFYYATEVYIKEGLTVPSAFTLDTTGTQVDGYLKYTESIRDKD